MIRDAEERYFDALFARSHWNEPDLECEECGSSDIEDNQCQECGACQTTEAERREQYESDRWDQIKEERRSCVD